MVASGVLLHATVGAAAAARVVAAPHLDLRLVLPAGLDAAEVEIGKKAVRFQSYAEPDDFDPLEDYFVELRRIRGSRDDLERSMRDCRSMDAVRTGRSGSLLWYRCQPDLAGDTDIDVLLGVLRGDHIYLISLAGALPAGQLEGLIQAILDGIL